MAVIPARAGSTRLKDKNFLDLGGIPLVAHTIQAVVNSDCFDKIVVSTDSSEIKKIAKDYGVDIHHRSEKHATTKATVLEAMLDLMKHNGEHDIFAYFLPTLIIVASYLVNRIRFSREHISHAADLLNHTF